MEQSIIMIPMYNPNSGTHAAIARVRFADGHAQVETRRSGFGQEEPQTLYLLTDAGIRAVRNNRAPFSKERLIGIASMTHQGACACGGPVRGFEKEFERMLVLLRMRYNDKPVSSAGVITVGQDDKPVSVLAAKTRARVETLDTASQRDNVRELARAPETASRQMDSAPAGLEEAQSVPVSLYGHECLRDEAAPGYDAASAMDDSDEEFTAFNKAQSSTLEAPVTQSAHDGFNSLTATAARANSTDEAYAYAREGMDAVPGLAPLFGHETLREPVEQDGAWTKITATLDESPADEISGREPDIADDLSSGYTDGGDGDPYPFDGTEPYSPESSMPVYSGYDEEAAPANSAALESILKKAESMFPHEGGSGEVSAPAHRVHPIGHGKKPPPCGPKPPPGTKPPRPPGHRPPPNPPGHRPPPPVPGPRPPVQPPPPVPGPRPPVQPPPPVPGPRPPVQPPPPVPGPRPPVQPPPPVPGPRPPIQPAQPCPSPLTQPDNKPLPFLLPQRTDNPFPKQFPGSSWIRVQRLQGQGYYLEGRMRRDNEVLVISAVPGEYNPVPPRHLQGFTRYIQTKSGGYWVRIKGE